jgi:hypothetical protein
VLTELRQYLMPRFPVWMDAPARVSLFAYDNHSVVVESFRDEPVKVTLSMEGEAKQLRNAATGEQIAGKPAPKPRFGRAPGRMQFTVEVQPHSFVAFTEE